MITPCWIGAMFLAAMAGIWIAHRVFAWRLHREKQDQAECRKYLLMAEQGRERRL